MAFVFRSEKKQSPFEIKIELKGDVEVIQQKQSNREDRVKHHIHKGLPFLIMKQNHKENNINVGQNISNCEDIKKIHSDLSKNKIQNRVKMMQKSILSKQNQQISDKFRADKQILNKLLQISEISGNQSKNLYPILYQKRGTNQKENRKHSEIQQRQNANRSKDHLNHLLIQSGKDEYSNNLLVKNAIKGNKKRIIKKQSLFKQTNIQKDDNKNLQVKAATIGFNSTKTDSSIEKPQLKQNLVKRKGSETKINLEDTATKMESQYQSDQYEEDATPGPGSYNYSTNYKSQFRSKRDKFNKIFYSSQERFRQTELKFQEITYVNQSSPEKLSSCQSFLSKSPKYQPIKQGPFPPPGSYQTRQSLEHQLVKKILKSSNSNIFISGSQRLKDLKLNGIPGPGEYQLDLSEQRLALEQNSLSFFCKSKLERNLSPTLNSDLKGQRNSKLMGFNKLNEQSLIHVNKDWVKEDMQFINPPPFMSGAERFPIISEPKKQYFCLPQQMKEIKQNHKAFNSSQNRAAPCVVGEGVGVGLYKIEAKSLQKPSFNLLFS